MAGLKALLLLLLTTLEARLGAGSHLGRLIPGSLSNISRDDRGLQEVVLATTTAFNNQSNDAFLFRASAIRRAERQIIRGLRYVVDLDISRTVCHKRENKDVTKCNFQPEGRLHQTFRCHSDVSVTPWLKEVKILDFFCKP